MTLSLAFIALLACGGNSILSMWSGVKIDAEPGFFILIAIYLTVFTWAVLHAQLLAALNVIWSQTWAALLNGVLALSLGLLLIPRFAVSGLAAALLLACACSTAWAYPYMLRKTVPADAHVFA